MADELLESVRDAFEGSIDFEGQKKAEWISTGLIVVTGIISFIVGYLKQDIWSSLFVGIGGALVTFIAVVPPWPIYNQNPLQWYSTPKVASSGTGSKAGAQTIMFNGQALSI